MSTCRNLFDSLFLRSLITRIVFHFIVQDIINLQKLQNMSMFQHTAQLSGQLPGLPNLGGNQTSSLLNSPLNLSVGGASALPPAPNESAVSPQLPQLILASGQLIQGIQGAQLIIPTAQG